MSKKIIPEGYKLLGTADANYNFLKTPKTIGKEKSDPTLDADISSVIYIIPSIDDNGNYMAPKINLSGYALRFKIIDRYFEIIMESSNLAGLFDIKLLINGNDAGLIFDSLKASATEDILYKNGWNKKYINTPIDLLNNAYYKSPSNLENSAEKYQLYVCQDFTDISCQDWLYIKPLYTEVMFRTCDDKYKYSQFKLGRYEIGSTISCIDNKTILINGGESITVPKYNIKRISGEYGRSCSPTDHKKITLEMQIENGSGLGIKMIDNIFDIVPSLGSKPIYKKTEFGWIQINAFQKNNNKWENISTPLYFDKSVSINILNHTKNPVDIEIEGQKYRAYPNTADPMPFKHLSKQALMKIKSSSGQILTSTTTPLIIQKSQSDNSILFIKDNNGIVNIDVYNQVAILTVSVEEAGNEGPICSATVYDGTNNIGSVYAGFTESFNITSGTYKVVGEGNCGTTLSGTITSDMHVSVNAGNQCLVEGTRITLADGSYKNIENLTYEDELLCWDFDNAKMTKTKPCSISKKSIASFYYKVKLSNGSTMNLVGTEEKSHRLFNYTKQKFMYPQDFDKDDYALTSNLEKAKILSIEKIRQQVNYYSIEAYYHLNYFAEDIMCGCRFSNVYPIENMKYIKKSEQINLNDRNDYLEIPDRLWYGLRLSEQKYNDKSNVMFYNTMKEHIVNNYLNREKEESK